MRRRPPLGIDAPCQIGRVLSNRQASIMTAPFGDMSKMVPFAPIKPEALMKSGEIWMKGVQDIAKDMTETSKGQIEEMMTTWKTMTTVKTFDELKELQSTFVTSFFEKSAAETKKLMEEFKDLAEKTMAPIKPDVAG